MDPDIPFSWDHIAGAYVHLNKLPEAKAVLQKAAWQKIAIPEMLAWRVPDRLSRKRPATTHAGY